VSVVARQRLSVALFPRHGDVSFKLQEGDLAAFYIWIQVTRRMVTVAILSEIM